MNRSLRIKILNKFSQVQSGQPAQPTTTLPPPPAVPTILYAHLNEGYNGATVSLIMQLTKLLNDSLHYASLGKSNFQQIIDNNLDLSGANPDELHVGLLSKKFFITFLNGRNQFGKKVEPNTISNWTTTILGSNEYNSLSQVSPTSTLSTKLGGNLKSLVLDKLNQIKQVNPTVR